MVAPEKAAEHAAPFSDAGAGACAKSWANTVGAKVETIATTAKTIAKANVLPCAIATTTKAAQELYIWDWLWGWGDQWIGGFMVGRGGIYRGFTAVGKRVGSKENVDRWIGGLGALREAKERVRDEEESQNGRRSVGEIVGADCSPTAKWHFLASK
jgi:hypothetical protein